MWIVIVILVVFFFVIVSKSGPVENKIKIELDVPNPEKCQDKTMIDFISDTDNYKLEPVYREYIKRKILLKPIYLEAINQKLTKNSIDIDYFYSKLGIKKVEIVEHFEIEDDYFEKPISLKKWAEINQEKEKRNLSADDFVRFKTNKIDSEYLTPQLDLEDKTHYFYGKKAVITGTFDSFPFRNELAYLLWSVGADIDTIVGKKTDVVILGEDAGWKKMELIEKHQPQVIDEQILLEYFLNYEPKFI